VARILVVEDEPNLRFAIGRTLKRAGHKIDEVDSLARMEAAAGRVAYDLVLCDVNLGTQSAHELVPKLRSEGFDGCLVLMTGYGSVEDAVRSMREGADDYVQKPLNMDELSMQVERWLEQRRTASRLRLYERMERASVRENPLLGESAAWTETVALAERFAQVPLSGVHEENASLPAVLLLGETGTGKGVLARHFHERTPENAEQESIPPFVHVNCSALPAQLIESELFGHAKGAFTDAKEAKPGLFEMADGGTIFLDEIGDMPMELQAKLLLVVEQGMLRRVGERRERRVRARIVAATNQDLARRVEAGEFRSDLYYRLATFSIELPPLRDRDRDALLIAERMVRHFAERFGRGERGLTPDAGDAVLRHDWPGNVREVVNVVQRAVMLSDGPSIDVAALGLGATRARPSQVAHANPPELRFDFERGTHSAEEVEKTLMIQALEHTHGNVARAARLIGMQRSSFRYRIERYGLEQRVRELSQR